MWPLEVLARSGRTQGGGPAPGLRPAAQGEAGATRATDCAPAQAAGPQAGSLGPVVGLTPDDAGAKFAKLFGGRDLDLELEEFNRTWRVAAEPVKFGSDVLHPRLMERLLAPDAKGLCLRIDGGDVLWWGAGRPALELVDVRLALLAEIVDSIPPFVWEDYGYDPIDAAARRG